MRIGTVTRSPSGRIEVSVLVNGAAQQLYRRPSDGRVFVAGRPGDVFQLQVRNCEIGRVEILNTVDGRNTLKDEPGGLDCQGLVFPGGTTGKFSGWRINDNETRQFVFGLPEGSIAERATGSTANVGWIGFAVFGDRTWTPSYTGGSISFAMGAGSATYSSNVGAAATEDFGPIATAAAGPSLGTHIGEVQADHVGRTTFTRSGSPDILVLGYDTAEALRGIMGAEPESLAFPGTGTGYEKYVAG